MTPEKKDVETLLKKHNEEDWSNIEELKFFAHVIDRTEDSQQPIESQCWQPQEEEQDIFI